MKIFRNPLSKRTGLEVSQFVIYEEGKLVSIFSRISRTLNMFKNMLNTNIENNRIMTRNCNETD